jgi:hypothetical protein
MVEEMNYLHEEPSPVLAEDFGGIVFHFQEASPSGISGKNK